MNIHGEPGDLVFMGPLEVFAGKLTGELHTKTPASDPYGQYLVCHPWSERLPEIATALHADPDAIGLILSPAQTRTLWNVVYAALDSVDLPYENTMALRDEIDRQLCEQKVEL